MKDSCILCGTETAYDVSTHIDMRVGYIEGAGQLCTSCYRKGTDREHLAVPVSTILDTPNDGELGAIIRRMYWESRD